MDTESWYTEYFLHMTSWEWQDTGLSSDVLQVEDVVVTPDPPKPGDACTIILRGTANAAITNGAFLVITVKLGLVKLLAKRCDLFAELKQGRSDGMDWSLESGGVDEPIRPGKVGLVCSLDLPANMPRAKFTVDVRGYNGDEENLFGILFKADFTPS